jgi:hypothetical protein
MIPKEKPIRDRGYLEWVRTLPCLCCGVLGVEAHHQAKTGHGTMGGKPGDDRCLPLCVFHHAFGGTKDHPGSVHGMGSLTGRAFWRHYDVDVEQWILRLNSAFEIASGRKVGDKGGQHGKDSRGIPILHRL